MPANDDVSAPGRADAPDEQETDGAGVAVEDAAAPGDADGRPGPDPADEPAACGEPRPRRGLVAGASVAALVVVAAAVWGVTSALHGSVPADAKIPVPPAKNPVFVADKRGAGQDQQSNVFKYSAAGVVSIEAANGSQLGSGVVITKSGYVLTADQGLPSSETLTVKLAESDKPCTATVVGVDADTNLELLQLSGAGFSPAKVGTSAGVSAHVQVASAGATPAAEGVTLTTGDITALGMSASTSDGHRLTGLMEVNSLTAPDTEYGGPLFDLSGQVIGIAIGNGSSGGTGYVVPINAALQTARQLAGQ
jgi:hypothetical protein